MRNSWGWTEDGDILRAHLVTAYFSRVSVGLCCRTSATCLSCGAIHQRLNQSQLLQEDIKSDVEYALKKDEEER